MLIKSKQITFKKTYFFSRLWSKDSVVLDWRILSVIRPNRGFPIKWIIKVFSSMLLIMRCQACMEVMCWLLYSLMTLSDITVIPQSHWLKYSFIISRELGDKKWSISSSYIAVLSYIDCLEICSNASDVK